MRKGFTGTATHQAGCGLDEISLAALRGCGLRSHAEVEQACRADESGCKQQKRRRLRYRRRRRADTGYRKSAIGCGLPVVEVEGIARSRIEGEACRRGSDGLGKGDVVDLTVVEADEGGSGRSGE